LANIQSRYFSHNQYYNFKRNYFSIKILSILSFFTQYVNLDGASFGYLRKNKKRAAVFQNLKFSKLKNVFLKQINLNFSFQNFGPQQTYSAHCEKFNGGQIFILRPIEHEKINFKEFFKMSRYYRKLQNFQIFFLSHSLSSC